MGASRRSIDERRHTVLAAASELIRSANVEWASSVTFGELAIATGIDQAQIARDFGSKDALVAELIDHLLDPGAYTHHYEDVAEWAESSPSAGNLGEALTDWARRNDELNRNSLDLLRAQMMLWAAADRGSTEWQCLRRVYKALVDEHVAEIEPVVDGAIAGGSVLSGWLSLRELVVIMNVVVEGLMIRAAIDPHAVAPDLTAKAAKALFASAFAEQGGTPDDTLSQVRLQVMRSPRSVPGPD